MPDFNLTKSAQAVDDSLALIDEANSKLVDGVIASAGVLLNETVTNAASVIPSANNIDAGSIAVSGDQVAFFGSNANGSFVRFYDGTQIAYMTLDLNAVSVAAANNMGGFRSAESTANFPAAFSTLTGIYGGGSVDNNSDGVDIAVGTVSQTVYAYALKSIASGTTGAITARILFVGRWK